MTSDLPLQRGDLLPNVRVPPPGPVSRGWVDRLAVRECPAITARRARRAQVLGAGDDDPIVWDSARGANVRDVDGNIYVDLTAGFGVAGVGHGHPDVVAAAQAQAGRLLHAMGDAFPDPQRIRLLERLAQWTGLDRAILGSSGSDAVEAALKTARVATGRDAVLSFTGSYHGLSYGALLASEYKSASFRQPFAGQLGPHCRRAPYGGALPDLSDVGAVIVEPIQGRGGVREPPPGWLAGLVQAARDAGAIVIFDEIYTGFGRTGARFAFQADPAMVAAGLVPDLVCVGKGMAGGYPISACVGRAAVMDAWGASRGEALHTQTFLGNPVGSAMALAAIDVVGALLPGVGETEAWLRAALARRDLPVRGRGLLLGVTVPDPLRVSRGLLSRGFIVLPSGQVDGAPGEGVPSGLVLCLTPPLNITRGQLSAFLEALDAELAA